MDFFFKNIRDTRLLLAKRKIKHLLQDILWKDNIELRLTEWLKNKTFKNHQLKQNNQLKVHNCYRFQ